MTFPKNIRDALPDQAGDPIGPVTPGTTNDELGKREGDAYTGNAVGVLAIVKNTDTTLYQGMERDAAGLKVGATVPGTGATNLGKAESGGHASGDVGVEQLVVVDDGTVPVPGVGQYVTPRMDPVYRGIIHVPSNQPQGASDAGIVAPGVLTTLASANGFKYYSLQVIRNLNVTSWTVDLEVSIGASFFAILQHTQADGTDKIKAIGPFAATSFRANVTALVIGPGVDITVVVLGFN